MAVQLVCFQHPSRLGLLGGSGPWGKTRSLSRSPVTLTSLMNGGWTLVTPVSHTYVQMCAADRTHNHGNVAEIVWSLSLLITRLGEEGTLKVWAFGSLQVCKKPEKTQSADTAYRVLCTPLPWPSGSSGTTGTKVTDLSTLIQCHLVTQNLQKDISRYSNASFSLILIFWFFSPMTLISLLMLSKASFMGNKTTAWACSCLYSQKKPVICSRGSCPQW